MSFDFDDVDGVDDDGEELDCLDLMGSMTEDEIIEMNNRYDDTQAEYEAWVSQKGFEALGRQYEPDEPNEVF